MIRPSASHRVLILGALTLLAACIMPPKPPILPAGGPGTGKGSMPSRVEKGANPFAGAYFMVDPESNAARQVDQWRSSRPADAKAIEKIAGQPSAAWFGDWNPQIERDVYMYVYSRNKAGALPVFVLYNVPNRDCGQYSKGGARSRGSYQTWIDAVANGIGSRRAVAVLEPDALGLLTKCLSPADQQNRLELLKYAVHKLKALSGTAVYIDAGHSAWMKVDEAAERLLAAGIGEADGFALNTSNYRPTDELLEYGRKISAKVGGKHFIIDTGRNGNGAPDAPIDSEASWCNPDGRALGAPSTSNTGEPLCDAFFWVKPPGESDGLCNHGFAAGMWMPEAALALAKRAKW